MRSPSSKSFATVASYVSAPDLRFANPSRLVATHGMNGKCPNYGQLSYDGYPAGYLPWESLVFDLGAASNKVVVFAVNDHGPQPCESVEYTVYLTNDPTSRELEQFPEVNGADPLKWNRAVLRTLYLEGWRKERPGNDPGLKYTQEGDSFATVWSMPCGIAFRYVGVIAGNDGYDLPACQYHSFDGEIDAVEVGGVLGHPAEGLLDQLHPGAQPFGQGLVGDRQGEGDGLRGAHLTNCPAWAARSRTGPGTMPSTTVPSRPTPIVAEVSSEIGRAHV